MSKKLFLLVMVCIVGALAVQSVQALPSFSRREGLPCQACHFRMPELNEFGMAYLRQGMRRLAEPCVVVKEPSLGVPYTLDWGKYLSVIGAPEFTAGTGKKSAFNAGDLDLWFAGPFDQKWSALADGVIDAQNGGAGVGEIYAQYITGPNPSFTSARLGQLLPFAVLLNGADGNLALSPPLALSTPTIVGQTADRDITSTWAPVSLLRAFELGFVNNAKWNGYIGAGQPRVSLESFPGFEAHTDYYGSLEYLFNPIGDSLTLYGYAGQTWLTPDVTSANFHRVGLFGNLFLSKTKITAGYIWGNDDGIAGDSLDNQGFWVQPNFLVSDSISVYARYDYFKHDRFDGGSDTAQGGVIGVSWWAATPIKLTLEGQFINPSEGSTNNAFKAQLLWAF